MVLYYAMQKDKDINVRESAIIAVLKIKKNKQRLYILEFKL